LLRALRRHCDDARRYCRRSLSRHGDGAADTAARRVWPTVPADVARAPIGPSNIAEAALSIVPESHPRAVWGGLAPLRSRHGSRPARAHAPVAAVGPGATFRDDQLAAILALAVDRRRLLVVERTGWGKSVVYFIASRLLRDGGAGPTVIVSPLLA